MPHLLDPHTQNALTAARAALTRAEEVKKKTAAVLARLQAQYQEIETQRLNIQKTLNAEVVAITQKMDEDTLSFLSAVTRPAA